MCLFRTVDLQKSLFFYLSPITMQVRLLLVFSVVFCAYSCADDNILTPRSFTNVADAEVRWKAYKLTKYTLMQQRSCFCIPLKYPLTLQIDSGGTVVSARDAVGSAVSTTFGTSVEKMFENIRSLQSRSDARVEVRYDSVYGFPRYINADPIKMAVDDEYMLETTLVR